MIRCTLASIGSTPVAVSIDLLYRETVYGWYGGVDRAFGSHNPNELLTWHVFEWGSTHGYRRYDWGGAGTPGEAYGVRDFKAKFGGEVVSFGRNVCIHAPFRFRMSRTVYQICRRWL
jgi:lipid II:glycine glycyltransferase (peptidoglycan interpeptide bridge formation enzyme)